MRLLVKPTTTKQKYATASFLIDSAKGVFLIVMGMLLEVSVHLLKTLAYTAIFILLLVYGILIIGDLQKDQKHVYRRRNN